MYYMGLCMYYRDYVCILWVYVLYYLYYRGLGMYHMGLCMYYIGLGIYYMGLCKVNANLCMDVILFLLLFSLFVIIWRPSPRTEWTMSE